MQLISYRFLKMVQSQNQHFTNIKQASGMKLQCDCVYGLIITNNVRQSAKEREIIAI